MSCLGVGLKGRGRRPWGMRKALWPLSDAAPEQPPSHPWHEGPPPLIFSPCLMNMGSTNSNPVEEEGWIFLPPAVPRRGGNRQQLESCPHTSPCKPVCWEEELLGGCLWRKGGVGVVGATGEGCLGGLWGDREVQGTYYVKYIKRILIAGRLAGAISVGVNGQAPGGEVHSHQAADL